MKTGRSVRSKSPLPSSVYKTKVTNSIWSKRILTSLGCATVASTLTPTAAAKSVPSPREHAMVGTCHLL